MFSRLSHVFAFGGMLLALALTGCEALHGPTERAGAPVRQFSNIRSSPLPPTLRRVAILPLSSPQTLGEVQRDLDITFRSELSKMMRFEVVPVSRPEVSELLQQEHILSSDELPAEALAVLRAKTGAGAALFTDLTEYRPYRPIVIGVRAKLVDLESLRIIWSADSVLDSSNPRVAAAARDATGSELVLQSPRRFAAFVAGQVFSTLPGRP